MLLVASLSTRPCCNPLIHRQPITSTGIVLVSPCYTDLGWASERAAGWYSRPWLWNNTKANAGFIMQFSSTNDGLIPWREHQHVHENLNSELHT